MAASMPFAGLAGRAGLILACILVGCGHAVAFTGPAMFGLSPRTRAAGHACQIPRLGLGPGALGTGGRAREFPLLAMSSMVDDDEDLEDKYADVDGPKGPTPLKADIQYFASCGTCKASYIIRPQDLGEGRKVKCAVCSNIWFQSTSKLQPMKDGYKTRPYPVDQYSGKQYGPIVSKHQRAGAVTLFVGNLPFSVTEDKIREIFAAHGDIASCSIICDPDTGRPKGYGFVDFVEEEAGPKAMQACDGMQVDGREIAVKISEDKFDNSRGSFGGRGRGDRGGFRGRGGDRGGRGRGGGPPPSGRDSAGKFIVKRADA